MSKQEVINFSRINTVSQVVRDILEYKKSGSVLDIGAGLGRNTFFLARKGFKVTALDTNKERIAELKRVAKKKKLKVKTIVANIANFQAKKRYDVVLAINSLHFLKSSQVPRTIKKIRGVTNLNGLNVITVHTNENPRGSRPHLFRHNELRRYYAKWKILEYNEKLGPPFRMRLSDRPKRKYRAVLIAQKT